MPFLETCRMEERVRILLDYDARNWGISQLCRRYGVCRDTFYDWRERRLSGGPAGSSRAPVKPQRRPAHGKPGKPVARRSARSD